MISARPKPVNMAVQGICRSKRKSDSGPRAMGMMSFDTSSPAAAANRHSRTDSATTNDNTVLSENPSAFSTANSGIRSRTDCSIVLPLKKSSMKNTAPNTALVRKFTSPKNCRSDCAPDLSELVRVATAEFANSLSI